ncbi:MAG: protein kinase [Pseudomonadota bacterium]
MSRCPKCAKEWPAGRSVCPDDGTLLYDTSDPVQGAAVFGAEPALAENPNDLPPGMIVGEYRVEDKLGEGGMGAVYSAIHPLIGKKAAIKVISPALCTDVSAVQRFAQEARSVNQIGHPNIVDVFSFGELPDGRSYFAMEWLQGETLGDRLARERNLPLAEGIEVLDQVADALDAAHETGIVHRDLKPDNVFLMAIRGNRQLVKLLDFGIAKLADTGEGAIAKTRTGMMMGTPGYMSPEQARGKNVDHRTDIYALGAMSFELVLGRLPFVAESAMDIVLKHLTEPAPAPKTLWPEIPELLDSIILGMLEKDPERRPSLAQIRGCLAEVRGMVFASMGGTAVGSGAFHSYSRVMTPPVGIPLQPTPYPPPMRAPTGPAQPAISTVPPLDMVAKPKRTALFAIVGGSVAAVAVAVALIVLQGNSGGSSQQASDPAATTQLASSQTPSQSTPPSGQQPSAQAGSTAGSNPAQPSAQAPATPKQPGTAATPDAARVAATVTITVNVTNARIEIDDRVVVESGSKAEVALDRAGYHKIFVTASGYRDFDKMIKVSQGDKAEVDAKLKPSSRHGGGGSETSDESKPTKPPKGQGPVGDDYTLDPFAK